MILASHGGSREITGVVNRGRHSISTISLLISREPLTVGRVLGRGFLINLGFLSLAFNISLQIGNLGNSPTSCLHQLLHPIQLLSKSRMLRAANSIKHVDLVLNTLSLDIEFLHNLSRRVRFRGES